MNHPSHWMKRLSQPSKIASILDWKKTANTVLAINFHKNRVGIAVASHPSRGVPCLELEPLRFDTTTVADGSGGGEMNHRRRRRRKTIADAIDRECLERFSEIVEEHKVCGVVVNWPVQRETGRMGAACGRVVFALERIWERSIESSSSSSSSVEAERPTADTGHKSTSASGEGCSEQQDGGLLSRPFCLWDARRIDREHPRKRVDAFGRCMSYGKNQEPRPSSSDSAPASRRSLSETTRPLLRSNVNSNNNDNNTASKNTATDERDYFAGREQYHEDEHTVVLGVWEDFCREHWPDLWRSAVATTTVWSSGTSTSTAAGRRSPRLSRAMAADLRATETKTKKRKKSLVAMR